MLYFLPIVNVALNSIRSGVLYQQWATDCQISDDSATVSSWIHQHAFIDQVFQQNADIINIPAINKQTTGEFQGARKYNGYLFEDIVGISGSDPVWCGSYDRWILDSFKETASQPSRSQLCDTGSGFIVFPQITRSENTG